VRSVVEDAERQPETHRSYADGRDARRPCSRGIILVSVLPDQPTPLWTLRRADHEIACTARLLPHGAKFRLEMDGHLYFTRRFPDGNALLEEAAGKRAELEADGWAPVD